MKRNPNIAIIGDLTVDTYVKSGEVRFGGAALNSAVWVRRAGGKATILSAVGTDRTGSDLRKSISKDHKMLTDGIRIIPGWTSSIDIHISQDGDRSYGTWDPGVLAAYHLRNTDLNVVRTSDAVSVTVYPQYIHILDELRRSLTRPKKTPIIAINYGDMKEFHHNREIIESYLKLSDFCVFGLDKDADEQFIQYLRALAKDQHTCMIITLGRYGSVVYADGGVFVEPAGNVRVVDTTGAGDAFLGGFLVRYCLTHDYQESLRAGTLAASDAVTRMGAY